MESRHVLAVFFLSAIFLGLFTSNCAGQLLDCNYGSKCWNRCIKRYWVIYCNVFCPPNCDIPWIPLRGHEGPLKKPLQDLTLDEWLPEDIDYIPLQVWDPDVDDHTDTDTDNLQMVVYHGSSEDDAHTPVVAS